MMTTATELATGAIQAASTEPLELLHREIRACRACVRAGRLAGANPLVTADPRPRRLMLIGQAPSRAAIQQWRPFAGVGGRKLVEWLSWAGLDEPTFRREIYMTAMTKCFPGPSPSGKGDRVPSRAELALCRPFLDRQLALVDPALVILVGGLAIEAFLGRVKLRDVVGRTFERDGRLFLPLPHPSGVSTWLNDPANVALVRQAAAHLHAWIAANLPHLLEAPPADAVAVEPDAEREPALVSEAIP